MMTHSDPYVSRGGDKLAAALEAFGIDPTGLVCADFGANVGGFTDCLLRRGAAKVYAIDTGYGELAWTLRKHPRVVVMERTNALHCEIPEPVDLVAADMAWTPQAYILPAAVRWLKPGGRVLSLLKCYYEQAKRERPARGRRRAPLTDQQAADVCRNVCKDLHAAGFDLRALARSPLRGKGNNVEYWLWASGGPAGARPRAGGDKK